MEAKGWCKGDGNEETRASARIRQPHHPPTIATVYVGIGSNIDPEKNLPAAATLLRKAFPKIRFSSVWKTSPQDREDQPDFHNAAAVFDTTATPKEISRALQAIERKLKKKTLFRFGPRTIDLDILLYGDEIHEEDDLTIPHARLHKRRFVVEPLIELGAGDLVHPGLDRKLKTFLKDVKGQKCRKIQNLEL